MQILEQNGWKNCNGVAVLKSPVIRLGWVEATHQFIMGYAGLPFPVDTIDRLNLALRFCGLQEIL